MSVSFSQTTLIGDIGITQPTVLQWGPDGRLYVASLNGDIAVLTIAQDASGNYVIVEREIITLVHDMPNHDDNGSYDAAVSGRQVTGLVVGGTAEAPIIYVSSSDPRVGGGASGTDSGLDTNSGVISRLTLDGGEWEKVDIVRGLPRSENNHSTNGLAFGPDGTTLLVAQGGMTNAGAPSTYLAGNSEYALSGAILEIDLTQLAQLEAVGLHSYQVGTAPTQYYVYDLPTLNDPTRPAAPDGSDLPGQGALGGDPFGGNDGLNMAKLVAGGPVQIYAPGFRNPYDVLVTEDGHIFSYDNGPAAALGGVPLDQNGGRYLGLAGQVATNLPNENGFGVVDNQDQLHDISVAGTYAGHPNAIRAFGSAAGLLASPGAGTTGATPVPPGQLPSDFGSVVATLDPRQAQYLQGGVADGAVDSGTGSINGLAEYTASGLITDGAGGFDSIEGAILATTFAGKLIIIDRFADGDGAVDSHIDANGKVVADSKQVIDLGGRPLGIDAVGDDGLFAGTIWVTNLSAGSIMILAPASGTPRVTITGTTRGDVISPSATVSGQPLPTQWDDTLLGLGGNDQLNGGLGADRMFGGAGNDTYTVDNAGDAAREDSMPGVDDGGTDLVKASVSFALGAFVENLTLTGSGAIAGTGNALANAITGNSGANILAGGDGADTLSGQGGNDALSGGDGADILIGGSGNDSADGGTGDDIFRVATGAGIDNYTGAAGTDSIVASANNAAIGLSGLSGVEAIGSGGFAGVKIVGSADADVLDFSAVALTGIGSINGAAGADSITGSAAADMILGGSGADVLRGGGSSDILIGGADRDQLFGGTGADIFRYAATSESKRGAADVINDFSRSDGDRIDLAGIDADTSLAGNQAFALIGDTAFHKQRGELRWHVESDGNTHVYGDTNGDGTADFELVLVGSIALQAGDFSL